ncbi:MAG: alpha/beta hydrolase [Dehalococcoidales bacterium]|nr:alpha/beta hydrolase [Dehalococcoidales bacterium]
MKHQEAGFKGYGDANLYYQCWLPDTEPRAVLVLAHGLAEHGGRYANVVDHLVPRGYALYAPDHRGHGRSEGGRCYVERFEHYLNDLEAFLAIVRREQPNCRLFLYGHSMGGTIALAYALQHQSELDGLIITGAVLRPGSSITAVHVLAARILSALLPRMGVTALDNGGISQDPEVVQAYVNDPLVYCGKVTARLGAEFLRVMQQLPTQVKGVHLPVLIMHGTEDILSDPQSSQLLYDRVPSEDKTLIFYEDYYHEIHNEPGRERVLVDMAGWLEART